MSSYRATISQLKLPYAANRLRRFDSTQEAAEDETGHFQRARTCDSIDEG